MRKKTIRLVVAAALLSLFVWWLGPTRNVEYSYEPVLGNIGDTEVSIRVFGRFQVFDRRWYSEVQKASPYHLSVDLYRDVGSNWQGRIKSLSLIGSDGQISYLQPDPSEYRSSETRGQGHTGSKLSFDQEGLELGSQEIIIKAEIEICESTGCQTYMLEGVLQQKTTVRYSLRILDIMSSV